MALQKDRREDQWPQSCPPSNTTWGKAMAGEKSLMSTGQTWTGMAVGERVIGRFRSRPHRHADSGGFRFSIAVQRLPSRVWHLVLAAWLGWQGVSHSFCFDANRDDSGSSMSREGLAVRNRSATSS